MQIGMIGLGRTGVSKVRAKENPALAPCNGHVSDSVEGRWTIRAAIDEGVLAPVLSAAIDARFTSRGNADFANRILSAMRHEFGGHVEKPSP